MVVTLKARQRVYWAWALLMVGGCTHPVGPDYVAPETVASSAQGNGKVLEQQVAHSQLYADASPPGQWWRLYQDTQLNDLIGQALGRNTTILEALANLQRVRAVEEEVTGQRRPLATASGGPSYGHASGLSRLQPGSVPANAWLYSTTAAVSYQLDVFGKLKRASEAAAADSDAAVAAMDVVRITVAAATAQAYADVCSGGLQLNAARESLQVQQEARRVTEHLQRAGHAGSVDSIRAQAQERQLAAAIAPLQAQRQAALYRLAALIGTVPAGVPSAVSQCDKPPVLETAMPVGDGVELLKRRPDVRQAERSLAASSARIGVAVAEFYPDVSLGLSAASAGRMDGYARGDTFSWGIGPLITWSLPNNGVVRARVKQAEAGAQAAMARFDTVVLEALRETETALNALVMEMQHHSELLAARDASASVARQVRLLYRNGKTNYLDALDAERALASSESALARSSAQLSRDQVTLFLALGGGWNNDNEPVR